MRKYLWMPAVLISFATFSQTGVKEITGEANYKSYLVANYYQNSTVTLMDASAFVKGELNAYFVPRDGQLLGRFTRPLIPSPGKYSMLLPITPGGTYVDVDQNGKADKGVQVFRVLIGLNFRGDSYLDQMEQAGLSSVLTDAKTGFIREGSLLIYAPDANQGFPTSWGKDKKLFSADDPTRKLQPGYTVAVINNSGSISFCREPICMMNTLEEKERATPDFSKQTILQSFNSLIDLLKERYAYTELRKINWEQMRARYLKEVEHADAQKDTGDYYIVLKNIVNEVRDAHVQVNSYLPSVSTKYIQRAVNRFSGYLGAFIIKLTDGRYVVTSINNNSPAQKSGWVIGTEVIAVNGLNIESHIDTISYSLSRSNRESYLLAKVNMALSFPTGSEVTVTYKQPGASQAITQKMTAVEKQDEDIATGTCKCPNLFEEPISYKFLADGDIGYIQWRSFAELPININVFEKFLESMQGREGMIIDLRGNIGGLIQLLYTMASYFFTADKSVPYQWIDFYNYDEGVHDFVKERGANLQLYAPRPELAYTGKLVVLVNDFTASAGEYFPQFLQKMKRATIIGEYASEGAGGSVNIVNLPGPIPFAYTGGRSFFAGTKEPNLEAKGVQLDIRVPITLENESKKKNCQDPVIEAAIEFLKK
jgi:C-terminal processing protease CtpA/Prc